MTKHQPIWTSHSPYQALYFFPNGHGASVINQSIGQGLAVIRAHDGKDPRQGFSLNYDTPIGWPKEGLDEDKVQELLTTISQWSPANA